MVEPLFLFNQFGDLERCILRPGHVHSAEDWRLVLEPVIARYRERGVDLSFRADAAFAKPEVYELLEAEGIRFAIRLPANQVLQERIGYLLKRPVGRPPKKPIVSYASFRYQVKGWTKARRVVAKVEWHQGELYPRVGFIVTNLARPAKRVVKFYNGRGRAEQHIKEGKNAIRWTRLSCHAFRHNAVRLQLHALAYNLANFLRTLALPADVEHWSLTTLREKLVKTGARIVRHGRYVVFQLAEVAVPRAPVRRDHASDRSAPTRTAPGMSIESKERNGNATGEVRPRSTEAPSKVTRTPLTRPEMGSVDGARPFDANSGCREPCFLGRRVRSSAFRDRHMGNIGKDDLAVRGRAYSHVQPRCHAHGHAGSPKCVTLRPYGAGTGLEARDRATISLADRNPSQHEQETEMSESYSLATEPEGVVASLLERFNSGKVSAMMTLYEPEAVFIARDGRTVTDHTEIAAELERDISLGLPLEAKARHVFVAGDIAQIVLDWSIDGTGPDGEHVHLEGSASDIVRRGADGLWRYLIDNPRGTAVRQPV